jgi:alkylated DNA repair dioxygenase AlkB
MEGCVTYTFGDVAENHVGMQKIGYFHAQGFQPRDLDHAQTYFEERSYACERIDLKEALVGLEFYEKAQDASLLIVRKGVKTFANPNEMWQEAKDLEWDTKAKMRGRVVNKRARYNLCFGFTSQEPDYANGKGRIVALKDVPMLNEVHTHLSEVLDEAGTHLFVEGNLYYDTRNCGIGYHGDSERRKVVAVRLGVSMPLCYQWYLQSEPIGPTITKELHHGDLYIMSEKAVGTDWKRRKIPTLRHAAGCKKYITPEEYSVNIIERICK